MNNILAVKKQMLSWVDEFDSLVDMPLSDLISTGKMLRAKIILSIAGNSIKAIKLSAIVELIHLASLCHDDVIDNSNLRRGNKTVHFVFGNKKSIMFGDLLYSKAYLELSNFEEKIVKSISFAVCQLSLGEILDEELSVAFNRSENLYLDMIYKKTASLIEACAYSAGIMAHKNANDLKNYGKNIGLAFQIVDDILDINSSEANFQKPVMQDFKSGKSTLPYISTYHNANSQEKKFILSCFKRKLNKIEGKKMKDLFIKYKSIEHSYNMAKTLMKKNDAMILNNDFLVSIQNKIIKRVS